MTSPSPSAAPPRSSPGARRARLLHRMVTGGVLRAGAVLAAVTLVCVQAPLLTGTAELSVGVALAAALAQGSALVLAPWWPRRAAALSVVVAVVLALLDRHGQFAHHALWPWPVVPLVNQCFVLAVVCLVAGWTSALALYLASVLVPTALAVVAAGSWHALEEPVSDLLLFASIAGTLLVLTSVLQSRVALGEALAREQRLSAAEHTARRLVEERARIARELHDVVAHSMSLISVQARSAAARLPDVPPAVAAEFEDIADRAKDALGQMRGVLSVLRTDSDAPDRAPQPGLAQVPDLVDTVRSAGADVALTWRVPPGLVVPALTGLSAHRIVQEALSNVMRHAADLPAEVSVVVLDEHLVVTVENVLLAVRAEPDGSHGGHGLLGMGERAAAAGGRLTSGPTSEGTYRVTAHLPLGTRPGHRSGDPAGAAR